MSEEKKGLKKEFKAPAAAPLKVSVPDASVKLYNCKEKHINIIYNDQEQVYSLLGLQGQFVLIKVIELICAVEEGENWPLVGLEISLTADIEDKDWQYILINLVFEADFESADKYLQRLYSKIDDLSSGLTAQDQDILQRMIYLDVKTALPGDHAG
jgi:hypothetical protein